MLISSNPISIRLVKYEPKRWSHQINSTASPIPIFILNKPLAMTEKINILFIDDVEMDLVFFQLMLDNEAINFRDSINCYFVDSSEKALDIFKKDIVIHILVQDIERPGVGGLDFSQLLYKLNYYPLIIIASSYYDKRAISTAYTEGKASFYLPKPVPENPFLPVLGQFIELIGKVIKQWDNENFYARIKQVPNSELRIESLIPYFNRLVLQEKTSA